MAWAFMRKQTMKMASLFFLFLFLSVVIGLRCLNALFERDFLIAWNEPLGNEFGAGYQAFEPVLLVVFVIVTILLFREWRFLRKLSAPCGKPKRSYH